MGGNSAYGQKLASKKGLDGAKRSLKLGNMEQIPSIIHQSWHPYLQPLFDDPKMQLLKNNILPRTKFYPEPKDIFRVFEMPVWAIRVVVLGQDPYPNGEAIGLAFAVKEGVNMPASLEVIAREVVNSGVETTVQPEAGKWRTLWHWHKQGVFLLNTGLTVEAKNPDSHTKQWEWFTREVVKIISIHAPNKPVWMMWGAKAKAFIGYLNGYYKWHSEFKGKEYNYIVQCDHPAAEKHNGGTSSTKFSGSGVFKTCNEILKLKGQSIINW